MDSHEEVLLLVFSVPEFQVEELAGFVELFVEIFDIVRSDVVLLVLVELVLLYLEQLLHQLGLAHLVLAGCSHELRWDWSLELWGLVFARWWATRHVSVRLAVDNRTLIVGDSELFEADGGDPVGIVGFGETDVDEDLGETIIDLLWLFVCLLRIKLSRSNEFGPLPVLVDQSELALLGGRCQALL